MNTKVTKTIWQGTKGRRGFKYSAKQVGQIKVSMAGTQANRWNTSGTHTGGKTQGTEHRPKDAKIYMLALNISTHSHTECFSRTSLKTKNRDIINRSKPEKEPLHTETKRGCRGRERPRLRLLDEGLCQSSVLVSKL